MNANTMAAALDQREQEDLVEEILRYGIRIDALGQILQNVFDEKDLQKLAKRIGFGYEECEKEHPEHQ